MLIIILYVVSILIAGQYYSSSLLQDLGFWLYDVFGVDVGIVGGVVYGSVVIYVFIALIVVFSYILFSYPLMVIGRKAGRRDGWKAFFPFVRDHLRLAIVGEPAWKMLFFGAFRIVFHLIFFILSVLIGGEYFIVWFITVSIIYNVFCIVFQCIYYCKFYRAFDFHPILSVAHFLPGLALVTDILLWIIAFDNKRKFRDSESNESHEKKKAGIFGISGTYIGQDFDLSDGQELLFGRDTKQVNVVFDQTDTFVGRKHCGVRYDSMTDEFIVTDYNSTNGTFYGNGVRLQGGVPTSLPTGTTIYLGDKKNSFMLKCQENVDAKEYTRARYR